MPIEQVTWLEAEKKTDKSGSASFLQIVTICSSLMNVLIVKTFYERIWYLPH